MNMEERGLITKNTCYQVVCLLLISVYIFPYVYLGTDATLLIHDNLDSVFVWYKVLLESGKLFSDNSQPIYQFINGLPRSCLMSEFDVMTVLFYVFGPYGAYVVNHILIRLAGFFGMYLLLKHHVVPGAQNSLIHNGVALCFALLPFFPLAGLSIAGIPLVVHAFLNIRNGKYGLGNWLIIGIYSACSSLVFSGFFLLFSLGLIWVHDLFAGRKTYPFFVALLLSSVTYIFVSYRLFLSFFFDSGFVSHRSEFFSGGVGLRSALEEALAMFSRGQYHAHSLHEPIILPLVLFAALFLGRYLAGITRRRYYLILVYIIACSLWYGLLRLETFSGTQSIGSVLIDIFPMNLSRFYTLYPVLWMLLLAIALSILLKISRKMIFVVIAILMAQTLYASSYHEIRRHRHGPSLAAFYAEEQFEKISNYIGRDKAEYRVVSLGIHPAIAQYNGFYTLDGDFANYPLSYKHQFRKIIAGELEKNESLKKYYDNWGCRVYLFSSELKERGGYVMNRAGNTFELLSLDINKTAFPP